MEISSVHPFFPPLTKEKQKSNWWIMYCFSNWNFSFFLLLLLLTLDCFEVPFDYVGIGNHEFDLSVKNLLHRVKQSTFKWLNSNIHTYTILWNYLFIVHSFKLLLLLKRLHFESLHFAELSYFLVSVVFLVLFPTISPKSVQTSLKYNFVVLTSLLFCPQYSVTVTFELWYSDWLDRDVHGKDSSIMY